MEHAYRFEYANVHRGLHYLSNTATQQFEDAREIVRRFLNAGAKEEIIFTRNATDAINLVASSFRGPKINAGDEIVLSIMEHHSNIVPWHFHRERKGAVLKWAPIADNGEFLLGPVRAPARRPKTKMVAITHMSNVLGTVTPIKEIVALAHAKGIPVLVDGSQAAVHARRGRQGYRRRLLRVHGPQDLWAIRHRRALRQEAKHLDAMQPYQGGGEMIETVQVDNITYGKAAAEIRGRNAANRRGRWSRRGALLYDAGGPRSHCQSRGGDRCLRACAGLPSCRG